MKTRVPHYLFPAAALLLACTSVPGSDYPTTVQIFSSLAYWRLNEAGPSPALRIYANSGSLGAAGNSYGVLDVANGQAGIVGTSVRLSNPGVVIGYCGSKIDVPWNAA